MKKTNADGSTENTPQQKTLGLKKVTLRDLDDEFLKGMAGGDNDTYLATCTINTCWTCD